MIFQTIGAAIADTLRIDGLGYFRLDTSDQQSHGADEILNLPLVHVYYDGGSFPKSGAVIGKQVHDAKYKIILSAASAAAADLANLDEANATPTTVLAVLAAVQASNDLADKAYDSLVSVVWNILRNPRNHDFGLGQGIISNLWIDEVQKSSPQYQGDVIILSGSLNLSLRCIEYPTSEPGLPGNGIDASLKPTADASANPLTIGMNPGVVPDLKFDPSPLGAKVGN